MIIFYFRTGITPDSGGAAVYYYVVSNRAPFALGCFGPITTEAECRALYPECDGVAQSFTTAHGTDDYDLDCPCFNPVTGGNMPGQGKPNYLGPNGFDAYQLDLMQGDRACNTLDGVSRACTQEEKDAVSALYSSQKCGNSGTTTMTCADITGATGGAFDCASQTNSINASPASITCGNQASGCTASECCTVAPAKTCANAGTQGGAFDCAGETNDINANPGSVTCDSQTAGCTATECCTVVPANSGTNPSGGGNSAVACNNKSEGDQCSFTYGGGPKAGQSFSGFCSGGACGAGTQQENPHFACPVSGQTEYTGTEAYKTGPSAAPLRGNVGCVDQGPLKIRPKGKAGRTVLDASNIYGAMGKFLNFIFIQVVTTCFFIFFFILLTSIFFSLFFVHHPIFYSS